MTRPKPRLWTVGALALAAAGACAVAEGREAGGRAAEDAAAAPQAITVSSRVPADLPQGANLAGAAAYAWQEFIALNWPAVPQNGAPGRRDTPDNSKRFGDPTYTGPLVWHTYRNKVEIFPGRGTPPGFGAGSGADFGYDSLPRFVYSDTVFVYRQPGTPIGPTPWINADENDEIGQDAMFAGVAEGQAFPGSQILFLAKANRTHYTYVARNRLFDSSVAGPAFSRTTGLVLAGDSAATPGSSRYVSFPNGTIEVKSAWRRLTPAEARSGRFYQTTIRFYRTGRPVPVPRTQPNVRRFYTYQDAVFGLVALHIIHKSPSRPHFVYATFEQADNLLTTAGQPVEDAEGRLLRNQSLPPTEAPISATPAQNPGTVGYTRTNVEQIRPSRSTARPGSRIYYKNTPGDSTPQGIVALNRRIHTIPPTIVQANQAAHQAIRQYNQANGIGSSPWLYYKLINVQYQPIDKAPGVIYNGPDQATYYQANAVVETDYNLQVFSGMFQPSFRTARGDTAKYPGRITDWCATNVTGQLNPACVGERSFRNTYVKGRAYNMGGCMGCHGNAQVFGSDFSFILLGGAVQGPQPASPDSSHLDLTRFVQFFGTPADNAQPGGN